jgi:hypothetical protein
MKVCNKEVCEQALQDYLNKEALKLKPSPGPELVCWEHQDGELPIKLSFSIKVF